MVLGLRQKLGILVLIKTAPVAKLLPWQLDLGCYCVSFVMHIYGAKFQEHCTRLRSSQYLPSPWNLLVEKKIGYAVTA